MLSVKSLKMINFCKSANCPSSSILLAFQHGETKADETRRIRHHLASCEFCAAEVEFYAHYPQAEEALCPETKIPAPLYQLAEALLGNEQKNFKLLNKLLNENEKLKLEKA